MSQVPCQLGEFYGMRVDFIANPRTQEVILCGILRFANVVDNRRQEVAFPIDQIPVVIETLNKEYQLAASKHRGEAPDPERPRPQVVRPVTLHVGTILGPNGEKLARRGHLRGRGGKPVAGPGSSGMVTAPGITPKPRATGKKIIFAPIKKKD